MRRLVITLDKELDLWLRKQVNQNDTVRKALKLYKDDISTPDTIAGLRNTYLKLYSYMNTHFERYDTSFEKLDKLIAMLETRM